MNKQKNKTPISKIILLIFSIVFVVLFLTMLLLSILSVRFVNMDTEQLESMKKVVFFFQWFSKFNVMNDPFSIFISILTSIGGVFFGIRIGQWIDDREEKEKLFDLWRKTHNFLNNMKLGIATTKTSINELAEYKIFWDSLQRADNVATRLLQEDELYIDISFAFSFLTFYNFSWSNYNNISEWKANAPKWEEVRIENWIASIDKLIVYTAGKANIINNNKKDIIDDNKKS